jgi:peptidase M23-like protein
MSVVLLAALQLGFTQKGTGSLTSVSPIGTEAFAVEWTVNNGSAEPITVDDPQLYFAVRGGWMHAIGPLLKGERVELPAGAEKSFPLQYQWSTPVTHAVIASRVRRGELRTHQVLSIPLHRKGFSRVPDALVDLPVNVGMIEPLEAFALGNEGMALWVIGQVQTLGEGVDLKSAHATVRTDVKSVAEQDVTPHLMGKKGGPLASFVALFKLPEDFAGGTLDFDVEVGSAAGAGAPATYRRTFRVDKGEPLRARSPVHGAWRFCNGPGETTHHTHTKCPEQRYAYDLLVERDGRTFEGDPKKNESYFAWDQPIHAVLAGTVVEVKDDVPDDPGNGDNPANEPRRNSHVLLKHEGDVFTLYVHVRQGSATVKAGDRMAAGQEIARVGNAGFTTEPHLHLAAFRIDETGRVRALPLRFEDLRAGAADGTPIAGVPVGGVTYFAPGPVVR